MSIRKSNTQSLFRRMYAGMTECVTLLKRGDDQEADQIRVVVLWGVKWDDIEKTGEPIQGSMTSNHRRILLVEKKRLLQAGVKYINSLDRFKDKEGRHWQPESTTVIYAEMFENVIRVHCLRVDPPDRVL